MFGEAPRPPHQSSAAASTVDGDQQALARRPGPLDRMRAHVIDHLRVDPLRGAAQGQFAQGRQIAARKIILDRARGPIADIDLALAQPGDEIVGRQIDDFDVVGMIDNGIGDCLAHAGMRDPRDDIVEAFDMLDIERRIDVDAGGQQFLDIEIALRVAALGRIRMGEFVDQNELGMPRQNGVDIHLGQHPALVDDIRGGG